MSITPDPTSNNFTRALSDVRKQAAILREARDYRSPLERALDDSPLLKEVRRIQSVARELQPHSLNFR